MYTVLKTSRQLAAWRQTQMTLDIRVQLGVEVGERLRRFPKTRSPRQVWRLRERLVLRVRCGNPRVRLKPRERPSCGFPGTPGVGGDAGMLGTIVVPIEAGARSGGVSAGAIVIRSDTSPGTITGVAPHRRY